MRGFEAASGLLADRIRKAGESRGFAMTRLLTHWAEVVGDDLARVTRPVRVSYGREGLGATLTVWAQGAVAPLVEMQKPQIAARVNAVYGYAAISRISLTQTDPGGAGFAEAPAPYAPPPPEPPPAIPSAAVAAVTEGVTDPGLHDALARLAANVMTKAKA
jgi:hypothetical protein